MNEPCLHVCPAPPVAGAPELCQGERLEAPPAQSGVAAEPLQIVGDGLCRCYTGSYAQSQRAEAHAHVRDLTASRWSSFPGLSVLCALWTLEIHPLHVQVP